MIVFPGSYILPSGLRGLWVVGYCWHNHCPIFWTVPSGPRTECLLFVLDSQDSCEAINTTVEGPVSQLFHVAHLFKGHVPSSGAFRVQVLGSPCFRSYRLIFICNPGDSLSSLLGALPCIMLLWGQFLQALASILLVYDNLNDLINPKLVSLKTFKSFFL